MKQIRRFGAFIASIAAIVIGLFVQVAAPPIERAVAVARDTWHAFSDFCAQAFLRLVSGLPERQDGVTASLRGFVQAKAYMLKQVKREQPRIEATWRACPST